VQHSLSEKDGMIVCMTMRPLWWWRLQLSTCIREQTATCLKGAVNGLLDSKHAGPLMTGPLLAEGID